MSESLPPTQPRAELTSGWVMSAAGDVAECLARLPATDRYEVGEEIARGGMGAVHRCRDRLLNRDLAIKVLLPQHADRPALLRRFVEEAQVGGRLQHPGIVPVHEIGRLSDGRVFFAMKLVEGKTLAELLARRADPGADLPSLLKIFEQICQTLGYAHAQRVIHRDLKPANVMVGEFGEVQVMDWGIAKVLTGTASAGAELHAADTAVESGTDAGAANSSATAAGTVLGTYAYMSPEQASGRAAETDERGDVFGLGAILCEILTGAPPYAGPARHDARALALAADLTPALARLDRCGADSELVALCKWCLAVDPAARPADGGAVAAAVTGHLAGVAERLKAAEVERAAAAARARAERGKRRLTLVLAATVLVGVVVAGGAWGWIREGRRARINQTAQEVNQALAGARESRRVADAMAPRTVGEWRTAEAERNRALADGEQAARALAAGEADDATRAELDALLPQLRAEAAAAARNRAMLERLHGITFLANDALSDDDFDYYLVQSGNEDRFLYSSRRGRAEYAQAFREFGIDVSALPPAGAAALVEREPIRLALVEALTDWLRLTDPGPERDRLDTLVQLVEHDPLRRRVLDGVRAADRPALLAVAREDAATKLPLPLLLLLADALFEGNETTAAIALVRRTQTAQPGEFWPSNKLGEYLMFTGQRDPVRVAEATRYFTAALVVRPVSQVARINLGDALTFLGEYDEAIDSYRLALADRPDIVFARTKLAIALAILGDDEKALAEGRRALELRPGSAWVHEAYGSVCAMVSRHADAAQAIRAAIALSPNISSYHSSLGRALTELGEHDAAVDAHREAIRLKSSGSSQASLAESLLRRNRPGDLAAARVAALEGVRLQPGSGVGLLALAAVYEAEGRRALAIEKTREAVRAAPHDSGAWWRLGTLLGRDHRYGEGMSALREAVRRAPPRGPRRAAMLTEFARLQAPVDPEAAEQTYREAIALSPGSSPAAEQLIDLLAGQSRLDDAAAVAEVVLKADPLAATVRNRLIDIRDKQGRLDDAIALCTSPAAVGDPRVRRRHARLLVDHDRPEDALDVIRPLTRNRTGAVDAAAWQVRAAIMAKMGLLDEAAHAYEMVLGARPSSEFSYVDASLEYAAVLLRRHRENGSLPGDGDLSRGYVYRGWALANSDRPLAAVAAYRAASTASPKNPRYLQNLAETLLKADSPIEARAAAEAALKLVPEDPVTLDMLGKCLLAIDDVTGACDVYRRAVAVPGGLRYRVAYGQCLIRAGRLADARTQFAAARDQVGTARCDAMRALEAKADEYASGKTAAEPERLVELAEFFAARDRVLPAARLYREAVRTGLLRDTDPQWRQAVVAAVRAGCGDGDAAKLSAAERAGWHQLARQWVRGALDRISLELPDPNRTARNRALLAGLRYSHALELLRADSAGESESVAWGRTWAEVETLHAHVVRKSAHHEGVEPP